MSKSIHITKRNFKGLTKKQIDEQAQENNSDLDQWTKKKGLKKEAKNNRKQNKIKLH